MNETESARYAQAWGEDQLEKYDLQKAFERQDQNLQAKLIMAQGLSERYEVPVNELLQYDTPGAMDMAAKSKQVESAETKALKDRIAVLEKNQRNEQAPPDQEFGGPGNTSGALSSDQKVDQALFADGIIDRNGNLIL